MPEPATPGDLIAEAVDAAVTYARAGERISAAIAALVPVAKSIVSAAEFEPEILPEATAALSHIEECSEALGRAFTFIDARFSVRAEALRNHPTEGGPTDDDVV